MQHLRKILGLLASVCVCVIACTTPAYAADAAASATGHPLVDTVFTYLGMLVAGLTTLGSLLPRTWKLTQVCARLATDVRGILTPDTEDDPSWVKKIRKDSNVMLLLSVLLVPGCALFQSAVAPAVVECAPDRQYLIDGLTHILAGDNAFDVLDAMKDDKGAEFVLCAVQRFRDRAASPAAAPAEADGLDAGATEAEAQDLAAQRADAYLERQ